jgi:hypothetical protein
MNGRTCQLCGKPLSRFSLGSGGDFCSREHRNQFRLREGMDRLEEANKVASLMRRRENAKTIPAAQLSSDSKGVPRVAPHMPVPVSHAPIRSFGHRTAGLETPGMAARCCGLLAPLPPPVPILSAARGPEPAGGFRDRPASLLPRPITESFPVAIAQAGTVIRRLRGSGAGEHKRDAAELGPRLHPTHTVQVRPLPSPAKNCHAAQPPRRLINCADRGRELRVSGGIGFRLPARRIRTVLFSAPRTEPLVRSTRLRDMPAAAKPGKGGGATLAVMRITIRNLFGPAPPKQQSTIEFHWPDTMAASGLTHRPAGEKRTCEVSWLAPDPCPPELRLQSGIVRLRLPAESVHSIPPPRPNAIQAARRLTLVAFQPQEKPFEWAPTALHGTLVSDMHFGAAPVRKVDAAPATLEEHFENGLQNWLGGTADWKVDVAGVRPGSLALFTPSLDAHDYALEFLTRIEKQGVTWVFRAANFNDYFQATLAAAPGGGYELSRSAVIGGSPEAATVRSVPAAPPARAGKTAVTLRTRAAGGDFTISLDGQVIDSWADSRLPAGGIGFMGVPEDRTRLYWVKVLPAGNVNKEHSKQ